MIKKIIDQLFSSSLVKSASVYTVASIINSAIPFILMPILTRYLSQSDYGVVSMFGILVSFTSPFISLSLHGAISRIYFERDSIDISVYISNCIYISIVCTSIVSVIYIIFSVQISKLTSIPRNVFWIVIVIAYMQFIITIVLTLWQVKEKPKQYGTLQISSTITNVIFSIILVVGVGLTWQGRIIAQIVSASIIFILSIRILLANKWVKFQLDFSYIRHALSFGIPLIPHSVGAIIMTMTDRVFITNMVGIETTGVYTIGYQIGMIINIVAIAANQAYTPWLYSKLKLNEISVKCKIVKMTYVYFVCIMAFSVVVSLGAPPFMSIIVGSKFQGSSIYVAWIAIGYAFNGMYYMMTAYIFYSQKTGFLAWITFPSAILNVFLNYYFIRKNGAIGAAQATTLIYLIKFSLTWIVASRIYEMPWNLFKHDQYVGGRV